MAFFNSAVTVLQTLVIALGAGPGIWGAINLEAVGMKVLATDSDKKIRNLYSSSITSS